MVCVITEASGKNNREQTIDALSIQRETTVLVEEKYCLLQEDQSLSGMQKCAV